MPEMGHVLTKYEIDVLRWHQDRARKVSDNEDRKDAQVTLANLGYLTRSPEDVFSVTVKGIKLLVKRR
jgi:hypothetical protein